MNLSPAAMFGCRGKWRYSDPARAERAARRKRRNSEEIVTVYRCTVPTCKGWHIGHKDDR